MVPCNNEKKLKLYVLLVDFYDDASNNEKKLKHINYFFW